MWHKFFAGFLSGLAVITFIPSSIILINRELTAILGALHISLGLIIWASIMTHCFAASCNKQVWKRAALYTAPCTFIYACILTYNLVAVAQ